MMGFTDVTRAIADCRGEGDCGCCVDNRRMFEGIRGLGVPNIRSGGRGRWFMGGGMGGA